MTKAVSPPSDPGRVKVVFGYQEGADAPLFVQAAAFIEADGIDGAVIVTDRPSVWLDALQMQMHVPASDIARPHTPADLAAAAPWTIIESADVPALAESFDALSPKALIINQSPHRYHNGSARALKVQDALRRLGNSAQTKVRIMAPTPSRFETTTVEKVMRSVDAFKL